MSEAGPLKVTTATWIAGSLGSTVTPGPVAGGAGGAVPDAAPAGLVAIGTAAVGGGFVPAAAGVLSLLLEPQPRAKSELAARGALPVTRRARRSSSRRSIRLAW